MKIFSKHDQRHFFEKGGAFPYICYLATLQAVIFGFSSCAQPKGNTISIQAIYNQAKSLKKDLGEVSDYNFSIERPRDSKYRIQVCSTLNVAGMDCILESEATSYYKNLIDNQNLVYTYLYSRNVHLNYEIKWFNFTGYSIGFIYTFSNAEHLLEDEIQIINGFILLDALSNKIYFMNFLDFPNNHKYPFVNTRDIMRLDSQLYPIYKISFASVSVTSIHSYEYKQAADH